MILTCPRCATRYLVDDLQVWSTGRTVQCDECGRRWRAAGAGVRPGSAQAAPEPSGGEPVARRPQFQPDVRTPDEASDIPTARADSAPAPETAPSGGGSLFAPARPTRRAPAAVTRGRQIRLLMPLGWAAALVLVVALAWAIARRDDVVRAVPGAAGAYSAVGLAAGSGGVSR